MPNKKRMARRGASISDRLELHSRPAADGSGCRIWIGARTAQGIGVLGIGPRGACKMWRAHKLALTVKLRRPIAPACDAVQTCDNKLCIEQSHLIERKRVTAGDYVGLREKLLRYSVLAEDGSACRLWCGGINATTGYGMMAIGHDSMGAHCVALEVKLGRPIREGYEACHTCDNPRCVEFDHLWEGTRADNGADMAAKNRSCYGERHHNAKLTETDVRSIRESTASISHLSRAFGVARYAVRLAKQGKTWARVA